MTARAISRLYHPVTFLVAAGAVWACSAFVVGMLPRIENAGSVAVGVTCDLVLLVPALYYLLLVRGRRWPAVGLVPVFIVSLLAAAWILPAEHRGLLTWFEWAVVPLELGLIGFIGWRAVASLRRIRSRLREGDDDAFDAIRDAAQETTGSSWAAGLIAQEIAMFYYAFFSWRRPLPPASPGFTSYRNNNYGVFLAAIMIVLIIETVAVHMLVFMLWSVVAAWIFSALSLYGLVWMIGDWQALRLRTSRVSAERILLRLGTRWDVEIPRDLLASVGPPQADQDGARPLKLVLIGQPDLEIRLSGPVTARGMYGLRRRATVVQLQVDDPDRFVEQVRKRATPPDPECGGATVSDPGGPTAR